MVSLSISLKLKLINPLFNQLFSQLFNLQLDQPFCQQFDLYLKLQSKNTLWNSNMLAERKFISVRAKEMFIGMEIKLLMLFLQTTRFIERSFTSRSSKE